MEDSTPVADAGAPPVEAPAAESTATEQQGAVEQQFDEQGNPIESGDDLFDIVHNGETKRLTRDEIRELAQKGFDYTQKTQSVAEDRAQVAAERESLARQAQIEQQLVVQRAQLTAIGQRMQQYESINWSALAEQDPAQYTRLDAEYKVLQRAAASASQAFSQAAAAREHEIRQQQEQSLSREFQGLVKAIPDLASPDSFAKFRQDLQSGAAKHYGVDAASLGQVLSLSSHKALLILRDALAHRAQLSRVPPSKPVTQAPEPPAKVAGGSTPANFNPERMSTDGWMRWRNQQMRKR